MGVSAAASSEAPMAERNEKAAPDVVRPMILTAFYVQVTRVNGEKTQIIKTPFVFTNDFAALMTEHTSVTAFCWPTVPMWIHAAPVALFVFLRSR